MSAQEQEARRDLKEVLRATLAAMPGVSLALLFGSRARGTARDSSDVDVAISAAGLDLADLAATLSDACGKMVDVVSLDDPGFPLLEELVRDAELIHEGWPGRYAEWRSRALLTLDLDRVWYERMRDAWISRVARQGI